MQVLAKTEYQDVYRVKDGVLLVINKFKPICYDRTVVLFRPKVKLSHKPVKPLALAMGSVK